MAFRVPGEGAHARGPRAARRASQGRLTRSQKAKVRWLDGEYESLEEWVPKVRLIACGDEKEALLEDERRMFVVLEVSGDVYGTTTYRVAFLTGA